MIQAAIAAVAIGAGIGMQLYGASKESAAAKQQGKIAARAAAKEKEMTDKKIIPILKKQRVAEENASKESLAAERLRAQQMELDATRTRREIIRAAVRARATTVSNAANQGAMGSSGFFGSLTQITGEQNRQLGGLSQNLMIGRGIFEHNENMAEFITESNRLRTKENIKRAKMGSQSNAAQAQIATAGVNNGSMYSNIGSTLVSSSGTISKLGSTDLFGPDGG